MRDIRDMEAFAKSQNAIEEIYAERRRQVDVKGWTSDRDDEHENRELAQAAACYAAGNNRLSVNGPKGPAFIWPWAPQYWKPGDRRRNLIKAGALIVAEIERIDRLAKSEGQS